MARNTTFEQRKQQSIAQNETQFGAEARARYGDAAVDAANQQLMSLTPEQWADKDALERAIIEQLKVAMAQGAPESEAARHLVELHMRWIKLHWGEAAFSNEAYVGLSQLYVSDPRFTAYYDERAGAGATEFLVSAMKFYASTR